MGGKSNNGRRGGAVSGSPQLHVDRCSPFPTIQLRHLVLHHLVHLRFAFSILGVLATVLVTEMPFTHDADTR